MFLKLLALFIFVPTIELIFLIFVGTQMGLVPTTLLIITTGVLGTWLTKREGLGVLRRLRTDLKGGMPPAQGLTEGALILAGGLLLLTPGIFTDIAGFTFIIPWTRRRIAPALLRYLAARFAPGTINTDKWRVHFNAKSSTPNDQASTSAPDPFDHPIP
jgi:UPF0716 protein FxsA